MWRWSGSYLIASASVERRGKWSAGAGFAKMRSDSMPKTYSSSNTLVSQFCFSNGWFRGFLSWYRITLCAITNKASQLPVDYIEALVNWMKFNRRNSQLRPKNLSTLPDTPAGITSYRWSNICNMDQTALPFEYLSGRTYNQQGEKTIWVQGSQQSG